MKKPLSLYTEAMITHLRIILFFLFLSLLYLLNMWGLFPGENHTMVLLYIFPFLLFGTYFKSKDQIHIPYHLGLLGILFVITTALSTVYAIHIQTAFEYQLSIISVFLIFIYVYNNAKQIQKFIIPFITVSSILSLIYSALIVFGKSYFSGIVPSHDEQLIYRVVGLSHYPQGVFIFFLLIVSYVYVTNRKQIISFAAVLVLSVLLWLSYLRSAYIGILAVIITNFFVGNTTIEKFRNAVLPVVVVLTTMVFMIIPLAVNQSIPVISQLHSIIVGDDTAFRYKDFDNGRIGFITTALQAISERPITGYGGGNFSYASLFYSKNMDYIVSTSHNIFLDIAVENGIVSLLLFFIIIFAISRKVIGQMRRKDVINRVIGSLFIGLLVFFQFNYYHLVAFLFVFFFVCGAILYEERNVLQDYFVVKSVSFLLAVIGVGIFIASYANAQGNPTLALQLYPIYDKAHRYKISEEYNSRRFDRVEIFMNRYAALYRDVPFNMSFLGRFNSYIGDNSKALDYYLLALDRAPRDTGYLVKVFELMSDVRSKKEAQTYVENHLRKYTILYPGMHFEDRNWFRMWCYSNGVYCYYEETVRNK